MRLPVLSTGINDTFPSLTPRSDFSMNFLLVQNVCVLLCHIPPLLLIHWHNFFTLSGGFGGCCGIGRIGEVPLNRDQYQVSQRFGGLVCASCCDRGFGLLMGSCASCCHRGFGFLLGSCDVFDPGFGLMCDFCDFGFDLLDCNDSESRAI